MNADPALVESTSPSLKLRRNCTAGETSEPKVTVAMMHGLDGLVVVPVVAVVVAVVVVGVTISSTAAVLVSPPPVPLTRIIVVLAGALLEAAMDRTEFVVPPAGGVTGLGLKPAVTPDGTFGTERVTGELKEPRDCTATLIVPTPPGLRVRLLGVTVIVNAAPVVVVVTAIAVNDPLADFPVLPTARTT